jgi:endonuclease/exonuclease/phosphatase family metal-dependent hydrolase
MRGKYRLSLLLTTLLMFLVPNQIKPGEVNPGKQIVPATTHKLKLLTWNIYMLPHCSLIHGNHERARMIAEKMAHSDYTIIVFEEAFDRGSRKILKKALKTIFPYTYGPANESSFSLRTNSGLWIVSKVPLQKLEEIEYKTRYGIDAMARKGAVMFEGEWQNQIFQLVCTHLQADSPDSIRRQQCSEMAGRLINRYAKANVPQFICGDFNIEADDEINYTYMLNVLDASNGGMEGDIHTSFDEIGNSLAKRENGKQRLIDYVLVRNTRFIKSIQRSIKIFKENHKNTQMDLSDHYGVEAVIDFDYIIGTLLN